MCASFRSRLAYFASAIVGVFLSTLPVHAQLVFVEGGVRSSISVGTPTPPSHTQSLNIQSFPVHTTLTAEVVNSTNVSQFDMELNGNFADWRMTASHRLTGIYGFLGSTGSIVITPSVDSLFSVDAWFHYNHPPSLLGNAFLSTRILIPGSDGNPPQVLFTASDFDGTFGLGPPVGTLTAKGSYVLTAGITYDVRFSTRTDNYSVPPPGAQWLGNGETHITISPVPEPAALALLAPALCLFIARRTRSRARPG